jgi:hypothetical protein
VSEFEPSSEKSFGVYSSSRLNGSSFEAVLCSIESISNGVSSLVTSEVEILDSNSLVSLLISGSLLI